MANEVLQGLTMLNSFLDQEVTKKRVADKETLNNKIAASIANKFLDLPENATEADIRRTTLQSMREAAATNTLAQNQSIIQGMANDRINALQRAKIEIADKALGEGLAKAVGEVIPAGMTGQGFAALLKIEKGLVQDSKPAIDDEGRSYYFAGQRWERNKGFVGGEKTYVDSRTDKDKLKIKGEELDLAGRINSKWAINTQVGAYQSKLRIDAAMGNYEPVQGQFASDDGKQLFRRPGDPATWKYIGKDASGKPQYQEYQGTPTSMKQFALDAKTNPMDKYLKDFAKQADSNAAGHLATLLQAGVISNTDVYTDNGKTVGKYYQILEAIMANPEKRKLIAEKKEDPTLGPIMTRLEQEIAAAYTKENKELYSSQYTEAARVAESYAKHSTWERDMFAYGKIKGKDAFGDKKQAWQFYEQNYSDYQLIDQKSPEELTEYFTGPKLEAATLTQKLIKSIGTYQYDDNNDLIIGSKTGKPIPRKTPTSFDNFSIKQKAYINATFKDILDYYK